MTVLAKAILWQNGMVMAFDESGAQIPDLQGRYEDVAEKVLAAANDSTLFQQGLWGRGAVTVSRELWIPRGVEQ